MIAWKISVTLFDWFQKLFGYEKIKIMVTCLVMSCKDADEYTGLISKLLTGFYKHVSCGKEGIKKKKEKTPPRMKEKY